MDDTKNDTSTTADNESINHDAATVNDKKRQLAMLFSIYSSTLVKILLYDKTQLELTINETSSSSSSTRGAASTNASSSTNNSGTVSTNPATATTTITFRRRRIQYQKFTW